MKLKKVVPSGNSWIHYKYEQFYNDKPILGNTYILHENNGRIISSNGSFAAGISCKSEPKISINQAKKSTLRHFTKGSKNQDPIKILSHEEVIVDVLFPKQSNNYVAAYSIDLMDHGEKKNCIVNGIDGTIIHTYSYRHYHNVKGHGKTKYYGEQEFYIDSIGPEYFILYDSMRNIQTYYQNDESLIPYINSSAIWDLENDLNDHVALDVHYGTSKFHDMMKNTFDWNGIDGNGGAMNPVILENNGQPFVNAFWNGENAFFGKGDCKYGPLTSLTIVGHEFMHGITEHTSKLIYSYESGAINEAMSDIFGKALEYKYDFENFSWELDPEIHNTEYSVIFRSMSDPNISECPKYYNGNFWNPNNDVHCNSGVLNYWFYILTTGWIGQNEVGEDIDIQAISFEDALQVLFKCQTSYLAPNANHSALYSASLLATEELFGAGSIQFNSIQEAWKAVGLTEVSPVVDIYDLKLISLDHEESQCLDGESISPKVKILNNGTITIHSGTEIKINVIENGFHNFSLILNEDLPSGGSVEFTCTDAFTVDEIGEINYIVTLPEPDEVITNNDQIVSFFNSNPSVYDISLDNILPERISCIHTDIEFEIQNLGCEKILTNSKFTLTLLSGNEVIETVDGLITKYIDSGKKVRITLPLTSDLDQEDLKVVFQYESDQNPLNDTLPLSVSTIPSFSGTSIIDFSDDSYLESFVVNNIDRTHIYELEGVSYLVVRGVDKNIYLWDYINPCFGYLNAFRFLDNVSMQTCIDASQYSNPMLSFDLLQLREIDSFPEFNEYKTMMKIHLQDEIYDETFYISDLQSSNFITHNYPIPKDFNGLLTLSFYAFDNLFQNPNLNLIDNIQIKETTAISESPIEEITLYPNPTKGILNIKSNLQIAKIEVFDFTGKQLLFESKDPAQIDISSLQNGIYILSIKSPNISTKHVKFVKI